MVGPNEIEMLRAEFARDCALPGPHVVMEKDGAHLRAVYASHLRNPGFAALVRLPRLLRPVRHLLAAEVYVYQFTTNSKAPFGGERSSWRQNYTAWQLADNLRAPNLVNVVLLLDEDTEFDGPMIFMPGCRRDDLTRQATGSRTPSYRHIDPDDIALTREQLAGVVGQRGMTSPKGPAGTVISGSHTVDAEHVPLSEDSSRHHAQRRDHSSRPAGSPRPEYLAGRPQAIGTEGCPTASADPRVASA